MHRKTGGTAPSITCGYEHMIRASAGPAQASAGRGGLMYRRAGAVGQPEHEMEQALGAGMGFLVFLAVAAGIGLLIGVLARLALPGPDPMSWLATMGYGLVGSVVGGAISRLVRLPALLDVVIAIACAALLIWYFRRRRRVVPRATID